MVPLTVVAAALYSGGASEAAAGVLTGQVVGWLVTPDADVDGITHEEVRWFKVNRVMGHAFHLFWYAYSKAFKHRGTSHIPIIGTLTRLAYASLLLSLIQVAVTHDLLFADLLVVRLYNAAPYFCHGAFIAWAIQDTVHSIFDVCSTWLKVRRLLWYSKI